MTHDHAHATRPVTRDRQRMRPRLWLRFAIVGSITATGHRPQALHEGIGRDAVSALRRSVAHSIDAWWPPQNDVTYVTYGRMVMVAHAHGHTTSRPHDT